MRKLLKCKAVFLILCTLLCMSRTFAAYAAETGDPEAASSVTETSGQAEAASASSASLDDGVLTVGTNAEFPPFEYNGGDGQPAGFDIELIKAIGERLGVDVDIQNMEFDALVTSISTGKIDCAIAGMTITEERKESVNFSDPYYDAEQYVVLNKDSKIKTADDLYGAHLGCQLGTTGNTIASDIAKEDEKTKVSSYNKTLDAINDLRNDRLDAVILDKNPASVFVEKYSSEIQAVPGGDFGFEIEQYAIAIPLEDSVLMYQINEVLGQMKEDGSYDKLVEEYIDNYEPPSSGNSIADKFRTAFIEEDRYKLYIKGFGVTIATSVLAALIGLVIGIIVALMRMSETRERKRTIFSHIAGVYIDIIRGTPAVLQLLIMWFIILANSKSPILVASLSFGINSGAYVAEIIRAGIQAVDHGQMEGGRAMGLSTVQTMRYIVLPQALKNALPPLCNEFITLLKETAIVGYVGMTDLTRQANMITSATYEAFMPLIGAAVIYFTVIKLLTIVFGKLERRLRESDNR